MQAIPGDILSGLFWAYLFLVSCKHFLGTVRIFFFEHGTTIQTGITCKKMLLYKSIEFGMALEKSATRYKQKAETLVSCYQTTNLLKNLFLFLVCKKGQNKDKSKFVTKTVVIIVRIILLKISLRLLVKTLLHNVFHWSLQSQNCK